MVRKFKPAPKQASANRIRERYLHQLGLQRGGVSSAHQPSHHWDDNNQNHVVVISGLPSLPEDRATNDNVVLESHDFSHADGNGSCYNEEGSNPNNGGKPSAISGGPPQQLYQPYPPPIPRGDSSHCSRSTLSTSPHNNHGHYLNNNGNVADESMTSRALACPHSLLKSHQIHNGGTATTTNNSTTSALPFSLTWGTSSQLSRSAAVLLDEVGGLGPPRSRSNTADHDSVSSAATATTAESSFTATGMVSRDWASAASATVTNSNNNNVVAIPHPQSGTASVSSMGDSVTSAPAPGVFFQGLLRGTNTTTSSTSGPTTAQQHCVATSSLTSALNRFNIDSDCEASIASNSIMDDPTMMSMDYYDDCSASCASHISEGGSIASTTNASTTKPHPKKKNKKIGKNQRLLDRASAHERLMQMRNDRSQKLRANMVHSSRGLPVPHQLGGGGGSTAAAAAASATTVVISSSPTRSCCSSSVISQASSIPLMHVDHQASSSTTTTPMGTLVGASAAAAYLSPPVLPQHPPSFDGGDLGRTPTASNRSQHSKSTTTNALPLGVHSNYHLQGSSIGSGGIANCRPLNYHPQLVSKIHMPPPPPPSNVMISDRQQDDPMSSSNSSQVSEMETNLANVVLSMQHGSQHDPNPPPSAPPPTPVVVKTAEKSVEDDVMEVAVTLSMLGGGKTNGGGGGMIPRVR